MNEETTKNNIVEIFKTLLKSEKYSWLIPIIVLSAIAYFLKLNISDITNNSVLLISQIIIISALIFKKPKIIDTARTDKMLLDAASKLEKTASNLTSILPDINNYNCVATQFNHRSKILELMIIYEAMKAYDDLKPFDETNKISTTEHDAVLRRLKISLILFKSDYIKDIDSYLGNDRNMDEDMKNDIEQVIETAINEIINLFEDITHNEKFFAVSSIATEMEGKLLSVIQKKLDQWKKIPILIKEV